MAPPRRPEIVIGLDVGKSSHWVCAATRDGEVLAAQRDFLTCESTRSKNRLHSILLESCPEFESPVDLSDAAELRLMAALDGPWSAALARGARRGKALKAVARKRLKVIYAVMRDKVPYVA